MKLEGLPRSNLWAWESAPLRCTDNGCLIVLTELRINNFAIIDHLALQFDQGLITFTGGTGAGKSIIIDAVETVLGGRVDTTMIRAGAERAAIEGDFRISPTVRVPLRAILTREDFQDDEDYVTLGREIRRKGRNVAHINGRSVSLSLLREVGDYLVDVHGQSEHLSLLRVRQHLRLLDSFANATLLLTAYQETYQNLRRVRRDLERLSEAERDVARRVDLLRYQINEIKAANLRPDEEDNLREERNRLANAESLASMAQEALFVLDEGDPETQAITDLLGLVVEALSQLARVDPSQVQLHERSQAMFDNLTEIATALRGYMESVEFNPRRLEQVEGRLDLIYNLKRKYGDSIAEVLVFAKDAEGELEDITQSEERIADLEVEEVTLLSKLAEEGQALSEVRHAAAEALSGTLEAELDELQMSGAQFAVDFQIRPDSNGVMLEDGQQVAFDANGLESVQFLVAPNPGEGLKPLAKIASGGEMSRLMLALKNVLAQADLTPTLIFDEIDQGIGGRIGAVVGRKLWRLAQQHQVLCITHLPQLAAYGGQHYRVLKQVRDGRTSTQVTSLENEARLRELAQMLGEVSEGTLRSAQEILEGVAESVEKQGV